MVAESLNVCSVADDDEWISLACGKDDDCPSCTDTDCGHWCHGDDGDDVGVLGLGAALTLAIVMVRAAAVQR